MLTIASVAELLSTSTDHVLGLIHSGRLPAVNIGMGKVKPRWRVSVDALEQFTTARTASARTTSRRTRRADPTVVEFF
jgi:excisionase family DNA binding protein